MTYQMAASSLQSITRGHEEYQTGAGHSHTGGHSCPNFRDEKQIRTRAMFNENLALFSQNSAAQTGVHHPTIGLFLRTGIQRVPYKLPLRQHITDFDNRNKLFRAIMSN